MSSPTPSADPVAEDEGTANADSPSVTPAPFQDAISTVQELLSKHVLASQTASHVREEGAGDADLAGVLGSELPYSLDTVPEGMTPHQWRLSLRKQRRALRKDELMWVWSVYGRGYLL